MSGADPTTPLPVSRSCFVCGEDNPHGLRLRFVRDGDEVSTRCVLGEHLAGFHPRTHGGVVAALLDEVMGWSTVLVSNRFTYTVELSVRYRDAVPVDRALVVRGRVTRDARRLLYTTAEIVAESAPDVVLASAQGKFMTVSEEETRTIADALVYDPDSWRLDHACPD